MSDPDSGDGPAALQAALRGSDDYLADVVGRSDTQVVEQKAPFLHHSKIYLIQIATQHGDAAQHVGYTPGEQAYLLDGDPEALIDLLRADGATIDSLNSAIAFAITYLTLGRSPRELFYIIRSIDDIQFLPDSTAAEARAQARLREQWAATIDPPAAETIPKGYRVTLYAMRQQMLERHVLQVGPDGATKDRSKTLIKHAPVVYGA